ncbi:hypothetical protein HNV11_12505 [Spirosoma taeanense]|uniref:Uncharacterized protein n=1 Tax=Spirosoma taeanense TaxID=2735870 RepID=A0A6M5YA32_9BACT|nr:hypothetical protein [Spirosoma taeanense]QJW90140.1 hypothetical protein HNV11_12505 [Spirosoma taeanense]
MMKRFFSFLLVLSTLLDAASAQTIYRSRKPGKESRPAAQNDTLPANSGSQAVAQGARANAVSARVGTKITQRGYRLEAKRVLDADQFGRNKYYSPNYRFSVDFNPMQSVAERRAQGVNLFSTWAHTEAEYNNLPFGDGFVYATEYGLHGPLEGAGYFERSLAAVEAHYQSLQSISGAQKGYWVANIENSNEWMPGSYDAPMPGYPYGGYGRGKFPEPWSSARKKTITLESTGEPNVTLETLAARGFAAWNREMITRRTNRIVLMLEIARRRSPAGAWIAYGASMYQGEPKLSNAYSTSVFQDGYADVSHIGGDADGNITLNGRRYQIKGDIYSHETFHLDYYYQFNFRMDKEEYTDIWINRNPTKQNYPAIWAAIKPRHVVADQKGHWQANRYRMKNRPGQSVRGTVCMRELQYEADKAGYVEGVPYPNDLIARVPPTMNTGCLDFLNGGDPCDDQPKIWIPPYEMYSYYAVHRFLEGGTPGAGFHIFHAPARFDPNREAGYNHEYHAVTALFQARNELQPYEKFFDSSTLVEDPEIQIGGRGAWSAYDGIQAYNYDGKGKYGPQKPAYSLRFQPTATGYQVLILGGMNQGWTDERTDNVRYQFPGMAEPVVFSVRLRGPAAQFFEFNVNKTDAGQIYTALPPAISASEKAGYAGRILTP